MRFLLTIFCWLCYTGAVCQTRPVGKILAEEIEVGKPFKFAISYLNTDSSEVFFPDAYYDFSPYEFVGQEFFMTRTDKRGSRDSTIYQLVSYEVQPWQQVSLPVFIRNGKDCTAVYSQTDSVKLKLLTSGTRLDLLSVKPEVRLLALDQQINFPAVFTALGASFLIFMLLFSFFGATMVKYWHLIKLFINHRDFKLSFLRIRKQITERSQVKDVEKATVLWKKYLEKLLNLPFSTYTTKEILDTIPNEALRQALEGIDGVIYGHSTKGRSLDELLNVLRTIAEDIYQQKKAEIKWHQQDTKLK